MNASRKTITTIAAAAAMALGGIAIAQTGDASGGGPTAGSASQTELSNGATTGSSMGAAPAAGTTDTSSTPATTDLSASTASPQVDRN